MGRLFQLVAAGVAVLSLNAIDVFAQTRADQPEEGFYRSSRPVEVGENHMVVTAHPTATATGLLILRNGGTAMDAAVAVQMVLNLVEPQSSGIGGGAFLLYRDGKTGRLTTYDGRETAPAAADPSYWLEGGGEPMAFRRAVPGGLSVGVPGTLKLLEEAHKKHGKLPWADVLTPAIGLAEAGFSVSPRLAASVSRAIGWGRFTAFPETLAYFTEKGEPLQEGFLRKNEPFAWTLRLIANGGSEAFYQGGIGAEIVSRVRNAEINPGVMTEADLAAYKIVERPPVCASYRRWEVCGMGPPSSGGLTVGQILKLLEPFDLASMGPGPEAAHLIAEASRLAFADRGRYMADSDFVQVPLAGLLDTDYLAERSKAIDPAKSMGKAEPGVPPGAPVNGKDGSKESSGTSHFVIVDGQGDMVSMTTTIETGFGSGLMVGGFLLNNELTDFSFRPEIDGRPVANRVEGGKRPRSSMAPTIVLEDGEPVLLIGSPGGSRIIGYVAQAIIAVLDWGMDPQAAVEMGHVINRNGGTDLEEGTPVADWAVALEAKGHTVKVRNLNSGLHVIQLKDGKFYGGADPRREGLAMTD